MVKAADYYSDRLLRKGSKFETLSVHCIITLNSGQRHLSLHPDATLYYGLHLPCFKLVIPPCDHKVF